MKTKVLWLIARPLSDGAIGETGTWQGALAKELSASGAIEHAVIAMGPVKEYTRRDYFNVKQWIVPDGRPCRRDGLPPASIVNSIIAAVHGFSPNLIHTWGTESFLGLLCSRGILAYPSLLEIQGLKGQIAKVYYGGLTWSEQLHCIGIKELIKRHTMQCDRRDFARWGLWEEEMIRGHRAVSVQSSWSCSHILAINPGARLFVVDLALRQPFYFSPGWISAAKNNVFCIAAYTSPFKGLHVAIRALALLRRRIPDVRLRIAGAHQRVGIRQDGYMRWVNLTIKELGLVDAVDWLGPLRAEQIVTELKYAAVTVIPTFIENCCTSMQEAMAVGTPVVASYVGGLPSLGKDEHSCLFFPPGDDAMCAYQIERVLSNAKLAQRLSLESRRIALVRNNRQRIVEKQLEIYENVVEAR